MNNHDSTVNLNLGASMNTTSAMLRQTVSIATLPHKKTHTGCKICKEQKRELLKAKMELETLKEEHEKLRTLYNKGPNLDLVKLQSNKSQIKAKDTFRMTNETLTYLNLNNKNNFAQLLMKCKEPGLDIDLDSRESDLMTFTTEFVEIFMDRLGKYIATNEHTERTKYKSTMYNLIESIQLTRFGEEVFPKIQKEIKTLLDKYDTVVESLNAEGVVEEKTDLPKDFDNKVLFSSAFKSALCFRAQNSSKDIESQITHGTKMVYPSEVQVLKLAVDHVQSILILFDADMRKILEETYSGRSYKSNAKSFDRSFWKLVEYSAGDKHPSFEYLFDLVRCRATFESLKQLELAFTKIKEEYKIIKLKNKLNTPLKNMTFNFIYKGMICEIQLIHGTIASEVENHQIYELLRCRSIQELYHVIEKWGGYNHITDRDNCKGKVIDNRPMESTKFEIERYIRAKLPDAPDNCEYRFLRSIEYGLTNKICDYWDAEFSEEDLVKKEEMNLIIQHEGQRIASISCSSKSSEARENIPTVSECLKTRKNFIVKVSGTYNNKGLSSLLFVTASQKEIKVGQKGDYDSTFEFFIPEGFYVVGIGGKKSKKVPNRNDPPRLFSIYIWLSRLNPFIRYPDESTYEGNFVNGHRNGYGISDEAHGARYEGEWKDDKKTGYGLCFYMNGEKYIGNWQDNKRHGHGIHYFQSGDRYEGDWADDKKNGVGEQYYATGDHYEGEWKDDRRDGIGRFYSKKSFYEGKWEEDLASGQGIYLGKKNGDRYEGFFNKHFRNVTGKITFANKDVFEGEWKQGDGHGVWTYASGEKYEGVWKKNDKDGDAKKDGDGKFTDKDGTEYAVTYELGRLMSGRDLIRGYKLERYCGDYKNGLKHGKGDYYNIYGKLTYQGEWLYELKEGKGTYFDLAGGKFIGTWKNNKQNGPGKYIYPDGESFEATYEKGKLKDGFGFQLVRNEDCYIGFFKNYKFNGEGTYYYLEGSKFKGTFVDGTMYKGTYTTAKGVEYQGEWKKIKDSREIYLLIPGGEEGTQLAISFIANAIRYEGGWKGEGKHGKGKFFTMDGRCIYEGMFNEGEMHGKGTYFDPKGMKFPCEYKKGRPRSDRSLIIYNDGKRYEGDIKEGKRDGKGILYHNKRRIRYEGDYRNDRQNGKGKYYDTKGRLQYEGEFKQDQFNGKGVFQNKEGKRYEGTYKDGKISDGTGIYYFPDSKAYYEGEIKGGKFQGKGKYYDTYGRLLYDGNWHNGMRDGYGTLYDPKGNIVYKGDFLNNEYEGWGDVYGPDGQVLKGRYDSNKITYGKGLFVDPYDNSIYAGDFRGGRFNGIGKYYNSRGLLIYDGGWQNDFKHGKGKLWDDDGNVIFDGYFRKNLFHGRGTFFKKGKSFEGDYVNGVIYSGKGLIVRKDGSYYEGNFEMGVFHGEGAFFDAKGNIRYKGDWQNGRRTGKGKLFTKDGSLQYEGDFINGILNGKGILYARDGKKEGEYKNGILWNGKGQVQHIEDGSYYEGEVREGKYEGRGALYSNTKKLVYQGEFKNCKPHGKGKFFNRNGEVIYDGEVRDGFYHGKGYLTEYNGAILWDSAKSQTKVLFTKYDGEFKEGRKHGKGNLLDHEGKFIFQGEWEDDLKQGLGKEFKDGFVWFEGLFEKGLYSGKGTMTSKDGKTMEGMYENGKLISGKGILNLEDGTIYEGDLKDGKFDGTGILLDNNKNIIYEGQFQDGKKHGIGKIYDKENKVLYSGQFQLDQIKGIGNGYFKDGTQVENTYEDGRPVDGKGIWVLNRVLRYEGDFSGSKFHGKGSFFDVKGRLIYRGDFKNGMRDGQGTLYGPEGNTIYEGEFKGGLFNGEGTLVTLIGQNKGIYKNGDIWTGPGTAFLRYGFSFDGNFHNGLMSGNGKIYNSDIKLFFEGEFKEGKRQGKGKEYLAGKLTWEGVYANNLPTGEGVSHVKEEILKVVRQEDSPIKQAAGKAKIPTIHFENGERYEGEIVDGKAHGEGKYYDSEKRLQYEGEFSENKRHGKGVFYDYKGNTIFQGKFNQGAMVEGELEILASSKDPFADHIYTGQFKDGHRHGKGKYTTKQRVVVYEGGICYGALHGTGKILIPGSHNKYETLEFNQNQVWAGKWFRNYECGSRYEGEFKNGVRNGHGVLYTTVEKKQVRYDGSWKNDKKDGKGKLYGDDGKLIYDGDFKDGYFDGKGKYRSVHGELNGEFKKGKFFNGNGYIENEYDGTLYRGDISNGIFEGKGALYTAQGTLIYEGTWKQGMKEGPGKLFDNDGLLFFEGTFVNNAFEGKGKLYIIHSWDFVYETEDQNEGRMAAQGGKWVPCIMTYDGDFVKGSQEGEGTLSFKDSPVYQGTWKNGKYEGRGKLYEDGKLLYEGEFKNGLYEGTGTHYPPGRKSYESTFSKGKVVDGKAFIVTPLETFYEGDIKNELFHGNGVLYSASNVKLYEGEWDNNERSGKGKSFDENGLLQYDGEWKNNKKSGKGIFYSKKTKLYEGSWFDDKYHGDGVLYDEGTEKIIYEGQFEKGKMHGKGKVYDQDGSIYEGTYKTGIISTGKGRKDVREGYYIGEFENSKCTGQGKIYSVNGALIFEGTFKNDKKNGKGKQYLNGKLYFEGTFKDDIYEGKGTRFSEDGRAFECEYQKGKAYNGNDIQTLPDGKIYEGQITDGAIEGAGILYSPDGKKIYEGNFSQGKFDGKGVLYTDEGVREGEYKEGNILTGYGEKIDADGAKYIGGFEFKKYHGRGTLYYPNSTTIKYSGMWYKGLMNGTGKLYNPDGSLKYSGNFVDNLPEGQCTSYGPGEKKIFEGSWDKGVFIRGTMHIYMGDKILGYYRGRFRNEKPDGECQFIKADDDSKTDVTFSDGKLRAGKGIITYGKDYYFGEVKDFQENGHGMYVLENKTVFEGEYINGKIKNGKGVYIFDSKGKYRYEGEFLNGLKHGKGITLDLTKNPVQKYEGIWEHDKPVSGLALYFYENGDYYVGQWENGQKSGMGSYYYCAGDRYEGNWKNGLQYAHGTFYYQDGRVYEGYFNKGCRVEFKD